MVGNAHPTVLHPAARAIIVANGCPLGMFSRADDVTEKPDFDPLYQWFGIPPAEQPPNHYRLLGIPLFEREPDVIETAANQRMAFLRSTHAGAHAAESQQLLNRVTEAKLCLLDPDRRTSYDFRLSTRLTHREPPSQASTAKATASAPPIAASRPVLVQAPVVWRAPVAQSIPVAQSLPVAQQPAPAAPVQPRREEPPRKQATTAERIKKQREKNLTTLRFSAIVIAALVIIIGGGAWLLHLIVTSVER